MSRKLFIQTITCLIVGLPSFTVANAQQGRAATNNLFIHMQHPLTDAPLQNAVPAVTHTPYRTFNGTNNNIGNSSKMLYGSADIALYREMAPAYGSSNPNNAMAGSTRPSAREISNVVVDEPVTNFNNRGLSSFNYVWGQFIDHDITLTPTANTESVPITLPSNEVIFTEPIPFTRSEVRAGTGVSNARQQSNLNTSWLDGSVVYGSETTRANWLRTFQKGKMKTSAGNFLPWNTTTGQKADPIDPNAPGMANDNGHTVKTFVAGDVRASEHPGILSLHTLFVREHNRICDRLWAQGYRNDEDIYQRARKEVGALIQTITYQEFLPAIGVTLRSYFGYNSNVRPDITNTFATAGYRLGHTMVADDILVLDNNCNGVGPAVLELLDVFWTPDTLLTYNVEPFFKGLAAHTQYETDTKINSILRNFLFVSPNDPVRFGIDLGSLNIQRGRDHGLPDYNKARLFYTGRAATKFSDITVNKALADSLKRLYGNNINNVDLWVGILAEDHVPGTSVGKTVQAMLKYQFENLRDADYYYYLYDPYLPLLSKIVIANTKLSDVIKRNTTLTNIQRNVFFTQECPGFPSEDRVARAGTGLANKSLLNEINADLKVYPNPVTDVITLNMGNTTEPYRIHILSGNGTIMKTIDGRDRTLKINVSGFANGIYMLNIVNGKTTKTIKFLKM